MGESKLQIGQLIDENRRLEEDVFKRHKHEVELSKRVLAAEERIAELEAEVKCLRTTTWAMQEARREGARKALEWVARTRPTWVCGVPIPKTDIDAALGGEVKD